MLGPYSNQTWWTWACTLSASDMRQQPKVCKGSSRKLTSGFLPAGPTDLLACCASRTRPIVTNHSMPLIGLASHDR